MLDLPVKQKIYPTEWSKVPISCPPMTLMLLKCVTHLMQKIFHLPEDWILLLEQTLLFMIEKTLLCLAEWKEKQGYQRAEGLA